MFDIISDIFYLLVFEPLFNLLIILLNIIPYSSLGISIIIVTLIVRFILYPSSKKSLETQKKIADIKPLLKEIEEKYKNDKQKKAEAQMTLYKEHKINPFGSLFFPLLVQLPILFGLYKIFTTDFLTNSASHHLYQNIFYPDFIGIYFVGINLAEASILIASVAAIIQHIQARSMIQIQNNKKDTEKNTEKDKQKKEPDMQTSMNFMMLYVLPIIILVFGTGIPYIGFEGLSAGISLYWATTTAFSLWQQKILYK